MNCVIRADNYSTQAVERRVVSEEDPPAADERRDGEESRDPTRAPLEELSLAERIVAAWFQDPVRGAVVAFLLLFALSFLVAFAMWLV